MTWWRRAWKWLAAVAILHFVLDALVIAGLAAAAYLGVGCAALRCDGAACYRTPAQQAARAEMTPRRRAHRDALLSIRAAREYRRDDQRRR